MFNELSEAANDWLRMTYTVTDAENHVKVLRNERQAQQQLANRARIVADKIHDLYPASGTAGPPASA